MTIKQSAQQKKIVLFECQKEGLSEAVPEELLEQGGWGKKQWNATAQQFDATICANGSQNAQGYEVWKQIEDERVCPTEKRLLFEGKLTKENNSEGGNNRLLILANSAELMSESEDNIRTVHLNTQDHEGYDSCYVTNYPLSMLDSTMEVEHLQENVNDFMATDTVTDNNWDKADEMPLFAHERNEGDGSHGEGTVTRLSQIRRQARHKSQSFMQQSIQKGTYRRLQGSKTRLTEIRRQARSGNHVSMQDDITGCSHGKFLGGITRLTQIRRQARSKNNCPLQEGTGKHMHRQLDCQFHEDNMLDMTWKVCMK